MAYSTEWDARQMGGWEAIGAAREMGERGDSTCVDDTKCEIFADEARFWYLWIQENISDLTARWDDDLLVSGTMCRVVAR